MSIDELSNGKARGIQLVQVEGFLEVARRGSVSRAADALFVTQPTLTARLHSLERELGASLFVRTPHGMRLTEAGRAWVPYAERALRALVDGRDVLEQVRTASAGHLMIGAAPAVSTYILPELLEQFVAAHPPRTSSTSCFATRCRSGLGVPSAIPSYSSDPSTPRSSCSYAPPSIRSASGAA